MKIVHVKKDPYDVYIGSNCSGLKASKWKMPWTISLWCSPHARRSYLSYYKQYVLASPDLMLSLPELKGKILGCWCAPKGGVTENDPLICHGQILAQLVNEYVKE